MPYCAQMIFSRGLMLSFEGPRRNSWLSRPATDSSPFFSVAVHSRDVAPLETCRAIWNIFPKLMIPNYQSLISLGVHLWSVNGRLISLSKRNGRVVHCKDP